MSNHKGRAQPGPSPDKSRKRVRSASSPSHQPVPISAAARAAVEQFLHCVSLDVDLEQTRKLQVTGKGLTHLPSALCTALSRLTSLDVSHNELEGDKDHVEDAPLFSLLPSLSHLVLSNNPKLNTLTRILNGASHLVVVSVANCGLTSLKGIESSSQTLKTLIANDNQLTLLSTSAAKKIDVMSSSQVLALETYEAIESLVGCEVVVLSRNTNLCRNREVAVEAMAADDSDATPSAEKDWDVQQERAALHPLFVFTKMNALKKLSISACSISSFPSRFFLPRVTELRLAHNELSSLHPESAIARSLHVLDASHNALSNASTLRRFKYLTQVNLKGNPMWDECAQHDRELGWTGELLPPTLVKSVLHFCPQVKRVDGVEAEKAAAIVMKKRAAAPAQQSTGEASSASSTLPAVEAAPEPDVVMELPEPPAPAPIVRRERHHMMNHNKKSSEKVITGSEAVTKILDRHVPQGW